MKKAQLFALTLAIVLCLSSFSGKDKVFDNANKWIPADFDTRHNILLVQNFEFLPVPGTEHLVDSVTMAKGLARSSENQTEDMKAYMKSKYLYKYEFASADQIKNDPKYADKQTYRFVLIASMRYIDGSNYAGGAVRVYDCHIFDRKLDKAYPETLKGLRGYLDKVFEPTVNTIMKFLTELK